MSINEIMTPLMDKFRDKTNLTDKLSIQRATNLMDHLKLIVNPNLLDRTNYTVEVLSGYPMWSNCSLIMLNPGKYTFAWSAKTNGSNKVVRIRLFDFTNNVVVPGESRFGKEFPLTNKRQSYTFVIPDDKYNYYLAVYGSASNQDQTAPVEFYNCKLENGDLATPLTEAGVTKPVLIGFVAPQLEVAA